jgi:hypothetical protein
MKANIRIKFGETMLYTFLTRNDEEPTFWFFYFSNYGDTAASWTDRFRWRMKEHNQQGCKGSIGSIIPMT